MEHSRNSKVSIIVPVYNAQSYIEDTINDLRIQTYSNIEIIIVNDGSVDDSLQLLEKLAKEDDRVKIFSIENQGPAKARNVGLEIATGKYVRFIDADDRVPSESIEYMVNVFDRDENIDLVLGNYFCYPSKNYFTGDIIDEKKMNQEEFITLFMRYIKSFYCGVVWNKLYKREIIERYHIRFTENIKWCEDFLFNIDYYSVCKFMYAVNIQGGVYVYCVRDEGITSTLSKWKDEEIAAVDMLREEKVRQYCKKYDMEELCDVEWKYASLYELLSITAKKSYHKSILVRYKRFEQILLEKDAYQYICTRETVDNHKIWRSIKKSIEKKRFINSFLFFWIKGCIVTYLKPIEVFLRKVADVFLPRRL